MMMNNKDINSKTKLLGLIGHPVSHSKGPIVYNHFLKKNNINVRYFCFDIKTNDLGKVIKGLRAMPFIGGNITLPHKEEMKKYIDEMTEEAKNIGSINTIYFKDNKLVGDNTDGKGFIRSVYEIAKYDVQRKKALVLGAGGAARAIVYELIQNDVKEIGIYSRTINRIKSLISSFEKIIKDTKLKIIEKKDLDDYTSEANIIINCTPIGLKEDDIMIINHKCLNKKQLVCDLIYNPKTKLIQTAEKMGIKSMNGLGMFVYQGIISFSAWVDIELDPEEVFNFLEKTDKG